MDIQKEIKKRAGAVKREYLIFERAQEERIRDIYDELSGEIEKLLIRSANKEGKIPSKMIADFRGKGMTGGLIRKLIVPFNSTIISLMRTSIKKSIDFGIRSNEEALSPFIKGKLKTILTPKQKLSIKDHVINKIMIMESKEMDREIPYPYFLRRVTPIISILEQEQLELPFSTRVWNLSYQNEMQILQLLQMGIIQEKDVHRVAQELQKYLIYPVEEYGKWLKALKTPPGVYKSAFKNAVRLQRTEMAKSYRESEIAYCKSRGDLLKGMGWNLGPGDNCGICIGLATVDKYGLGPGIYPINKYPKIPHPH